MSSPTRPWRTPGRGRVGLLTLLLHTYTNELYVLPDQVVKQSSPGHEHGSLTSRQRRLKTLCRLGSYGL